MVLVKRVLVTVMDVIEMVSVAHGLVPAVGAVGVVPDAVLRRGIVLVVVITVLGMAVALVDVDVVTVYCFVAALFTVMVFCNGMFCRRMLVHCWLP